jgi:hypothetical protein
VTATILGTQYISPDDIPTGAFHQLPAGCCLHIFDCFLYHNEGYMLYLHLFTLSPCIDTFILGFSNISFTNRHFSRVSYDPFEAEIMAFRNQIHFLFIDLLNLPLATSLYRNGTAWKREATARNYLIEGVRQFRPLARDLVLLCDVDEIPTRDAIALVREQPPAQYYNLHGTLFHYSYRWRVGDWDRPMVFKFGAIAAPLDDYKFQEYLLDLPGVLHHHCSFCFPTIREILWKLASFSHVEYSRGQFRDPRYVAARVACGYGVLPPRWKMPERLKLRDFDGTIVLPDDPRFDFFRYRIGFTDLEEYNLSYEDVRQYMPRRCGLKREARTGAVVKLL